MMKSVFHVSQFYMMWGSFIKSNYAKIYVHSQFHFPHEWLYFFTKLFCLWSMIYDLTLMTWTRKLLLCRILLVNDVNSKVFGFVLQHLSGEYL
jgi:hypothetical protein